MDADESPAKSAKDVHLASGNNKGVLSMLCLGLKGENDCAFGDPQDEPHCDVPKSKTKFKVDDKACMSEMERCAVRTDCSSEELECHASESLAQS